jgi:hypothetical protein
MSLIPSSALTETQIEARRSNARHSTGPRTPEGKARSRMNALQHGGYATAAAWSDAALKAAGEDPQQFHLLRSSLQQAQGPGNEPLWESQLDDLARLIWRRQRLERAWEILGARHVESGEPGELVALSPEGERMLGQLDAVDRAIDRKTRLLLRLREAEARHRRELLHSARCSARQRTQLVDQGVDNRTPTEEELARDEAQLALRQEQNARLERQVGALLEGLEDFAAQQKTQERSEEVVEKKEL